MKCRLGIVLIGFAVSHARGAAPLADLRVYPERLTLATARDMQRFIVQAEYADRITGDVTAEATVALDAEGIVTLEGNQVRPLADGAAVATITVGDQTCTLPIEVRDAKADRPISFRLDVMPVFMRAGCNTGSCHGSSRGQDGFRLSLFGFDPAGDYHRLTRDMIGRRVNISQASESMLLLKSTGEVAHTGGDLFARDSQYFRTIEEWLDNVAPDDPADVAKVTAVDVFPPHSVLAAGEGTQQFVVRASYSDGTTRDVTDLAVFLTSDEQTAPVSETGLVRGGLQGEAFIMARFDAVTVGAPVLVVPADLAYEFPDMQPANYIDEHVFEKWRKLRLLPAARCSDEVFYRRVSIDLIGQLPDRDALQAFLAEERPDKRSLLVDRLLARKEFVELWVMYWAEQLQIRSQGNLSYKSTLLYYTWLKDRIAAGIPMSEIVRELLSASGGTFANPPTNYYQNETDTLLIAEDTTQVFMGIRLQCAQCHNHPFDRWTMDDYYGFAAFFARVGRKNTDDPRERIVFDKSGGEVTHPVGGANMRPRFLGGDVPEMKPEERRLKLAEWLTTPENPFFARNLANRVWGHFFGRGIVEPVDDFRVSNPPANGELLDALSENLVAYNYDFKMLVRDICLSETYQRATDTQSASLAGLRNFTHAQVRRIRAEVLLDCISQVTETRNKFDGLPVGARAVQIADGNTSTYFLTTFGRARRTSPCSCEVVREPSLSQALHLLNGETTQNKISEGGVVKSLLDSGVAPPQVIDDLYVRCLSRTPLEDESKRLMAQVASAADAHEGLSDVFWAILNSKEFVFNH